MFTALKGKRWLGSQTVNPLTVVYGGRGTEPGLKASSRVKADT